jgi:hypothetical protein
MTVQIISLSGFFVILFFFSELYSGTLEEGLEKISHVIREADLAYYKEVSVPG